MGEKSIVSRRPVRPATIASSPTKQHAAPCAPDICYQRQELSSPPSLFDLSAELRGLIYKNLFANVVIRLLRCHKDSLALNPPSWPSICSSPFSLQLDDPAIEEEPHDELEYWDMIISDDHDEFLLDPSNESEVHTYARRCRKDGWRLPCEHQDLSIRSRSLYAVVPLLQSCRLVLLEAEPVLWSSVTLRIESQDVSKFDLSSSFCNRVFQDILEITLDTRHLDPRYGFEFDFFELPSLRRIYLREHYSRFSQQCFSSPSITALSGVPFGVFDDTFIDSWLQEMKLIKRKEEEIIHDEPNAFVRGFIREKNACHYRLRDFMLTSYDTVPPPTQRLQIIKRWHLRLKLRQHIRSYDCLRPSPMGKMMPTRYADTIWRRKTIFVAIEFDVHSRNVMCRQVTDEAGEAFADSEELVGALEAQDAEHEPTLWKDVVDHKMDAIDDEDGRSKCWFDREARWTPSSP